MAEYVTHDLCHQRRRECPGSTSLPLRLLLPILIALCAMIVSSHLMLSGTLAATRESAGGVSTEIRLRAEQQQVLDRKLDRVLVEIAEIRAAIGRLTAATGKNP